MIGECIPLKVFAQISEHAASPTELRARTDQHFLAIKPHCQHKVMTKIAESLVTSRHMQ